MDSSENEKYLGDLISNDGSNTKNVQARRAKGMGNVDQIMDILNGTVFGPFYFEVVLLRKTLLVNSILTNSEAWYGLKNVEIEKLEQVDEGFLRRFLEAGKCCPKEILYLETGTFPLRFTIITRRLMFFHYLLNEESESLVSRFLKTQIKNPSKNDWIVSVENDLKLLEIYLSHEDIQALSKQQFKSFVQDKIEEKALKYLNDLKRSHSKVSHIQHTRLEAQAYLAPENVIDI